MPHLLQVPTWPMRMFRRVNKQLTSAYQYFNLIFGTSDYQPQQPSDEAVSIMKVLFGVLNSRQNQPRDSLSGLSLVKSKLAECRDLDALVLVTNSDGYNFLQLAVIQADIKFLQVLVSEGLNLNSGKCCFPLHLACKLSKTDMVEYLLHEGAKPNIETGMCYPKPHTPVRHVPSRFHFLETDIYACDSEQQLPVMYAIQADCVSIVRILMEVYQPKFSWPYQRQPLHHACRHGAYESMHYLVSVQNQDVYEEDDEGCTPLLHAVKWGKRFVQFLVEEAGANIDATSMKKFTVLHQLYQNIQDPLELYATTWFLLSAGMEQGINRTDCNNNTALHLLVSQVNSLVKSFPHRYHHTRDQATFDEQVVDTIGLLLINNCDPNIVSSSGVTALHKLLLTFDFVISNDPTGITLETLPARERYKVDFSILYKVINVLLEHGADPNIISGAGRTPLVMLLQSMLNVDPAKFEEYSDGFKSCIYLLCDYGTTPSISTATHVATIITLCKFGHKCLSQRDVRIKMAMSDFLSSVLAVLLQHNLDSNHCSLHNKHKVDGDNGNLLVELVKLSQFIRDPADLELIHGWVLTSLQWGANPDIEPYPSESIICTSQSSIYLKPKGTQPVNQYMFHIQDVQTLFEGLGGHAERLLQLFHNSMDHRALFHCLGSAKFMSRFNPNSSRIPSAKFLQMIGNFTSQPRSLKQNARVVIYKMINRQLNLKVKHLPLPKSLQEYLTNVE